MAQRLLSRARLSGTGCLLRWLSVALLVAATGVACSRDPKLADDPEPPEWTLDEVRQLTDVTDETVSLVRTVSEGVEDLSRLEAQVIPLINAVQSAFDLIRGHRNAGRLENELESREYAEVSACVEMVFIELQNLLVQINQLKKATPAGDADAISLAESFVVRVARDHTRCATSLAEFLGGTESGVAKEGPGVATGAVYASAAAHRAVAGLELNALLEDQIATHEGMVARLEPACEPAHAQPENGAINKVSARCVPYVVARDALPKLRSALSLISAEGV